MPIVAADLRALQLTSIAVALAWIGVVGSAIVLVGLPLDLVGWLHGPVTQLMWLPIAVFEIVGGFWLLIKGVREQPA